MLDNIVALLRTDGRLRHVNPATMASIVNYCADHLDANLEKNARRHPLGFAVVSERLAEGATLRYHLWPSGWPLPVGQESGQMHDHCFELNSLILTGSLRQRTFGTRIEETGRHEIVEVNYTSTGSTLRRTGLLARLEQESDEIFDAGTAYRLSPGVVHYIELLQRPATTMVLAIACPDAPAPRVFVPLGEEPSAEFHRDLLDTQERAMARSAIAELRMTAKV